MRNRMRAKSDPFLMQSSHLGPGQVVGTLDARRSVPDPVGWKKNGGCESTLLDYLHCLSIKIPVTMIKSDDDLMGKIQTGLNFSPCFREAEAAKALVPQPPHLFGKHSRRRVNVVVRMRFAEKILRNTVIHQDRQSSPLPCTQKACQG